MPPKAKYSKEDILRVAFKIVEENGLSELTARAIGEKLHSSTSPVYNHFKSMEIMELEIMKGIQKELLAYSVKPYTESVFLNMGIGIAMFACEKSNLYRAILLESDNYRDMIHDFLNILEKEMAKDTRFTTFSSAELRTLLDKMWVFTHGLASLICVGLIKDCNQEYIKKTLQNIGSDVIGAAVKKHNSK